MKYLLREIFVFRGKNFLIEIQNIHLDSVDFSVSTNNQSYL
jgi:hypothetical protein